MQNNYFYLFIGSNAKNIFINLLFYVNPDRQNSL